MTPREEQLRAEICEVGRRVYARGYVASNDGNISVRLDDRHLLATPKNVSKGFMTPDMMVVTDMEGRKVAGHRDASTELKMHLAVYEMRPGHQRRRPRASAAVDRICRRRRAAEQVVAGRDHLLARQRAHRRVRHARPRRNCPTR